MNKILNKIRGLFKEDNQFIKDESLKAVHTWLAEDKLQKAEPVKAQPVVSRGYQSYQKVATETKNQEAKKITEFLAGAKTKFTEAEFKDRKEEILIFLEELKKSKKK